MNARRLRPYLIAAAVLALLVLALWPSSRLVDSAPVEHGAVMATVDAEGRTRVRDRYELTAPVAAMARRLMIEPGDTVGRGDVLVVLDAVVSPALDRRSREEATARVEAARARLAAAREEARAAASLAAQARADDTRQQALLARQLVSIDAAEHARTARLRAEREAASARFREATAAHELEAAQAALAQGATNGEAAMVLTAPVDGVVLRRYFESARPVQVGERLLEIGDPAALEVEVDVLSADAVRLREGMRVELLRWGGPGALPARVRRVEPGGFTKISALGVEEQRVWVILDIEEAGMDGARLGDAYRVNARFVLEEREQAARVPSSAVFRHDGGQAVFRIERGRARLTPVRIGIQGGGWAEVLEGLEAGQRVIVHPDRELADRDRVRARE